MMPNEPMRLEHDDLFSPKVEAYLEEQAVLRRPVPEFTPRPLLIRILLSSYFYLSIASALGAFCGWAMLEPFFDDRDIGEKFDFAALLMFPTVAGMIGLFLGTCEGLLCRNLSRAGLCGLVGLAVGFGGGLVAIFAGGCIFLIMGSIGAAIHLSSKQAQDKVTGLALLVSIMGRGMAWAVAAIPAGLGQGIALRSRKIVLNGLLGGVLGGLIGGLLFDPINMLLATPENAAVSRAVGFTVIGAMVGLFVGFVEQWTKTAWLMMRTGPLAGQAVHPLPEPDCPRQLAQGGRLPLQGRGHRTAARPHPQPRRPLRDRRLQHSRRHLRQRHPRAKTDVAVRRSDCARQDRAGVRAEGFVSPYFADYCQVRSCRCPFGWTALRVVRNCKCRKPPLASA